jgi:RNA polymerase sigma-70 factor (ECF subfamily)
MEEKQLVRLAQEGSPQAFEELVAKYQPKVFSMALSFTRNREAADDLAQEVFLKAYLALPRFHGKSEFGTWLYRISINHVRDFLRKKGRAKEVSLDDVPEISFSDREQAERAEQERESEARRALVQKSVQDLPEKYRIIRPKTITGMAAIRPSAAFGPCCDPASDVTDGCSGSTCGASLYCSGITGLATPIGGDATTVALAG